MASVSIPKTLSPSKIKGAKFDHLAVTSSYLASVEYDPVNRALTTHMLSGAIYQHKDFDKGDWEALKTSKDPGKFWANVVKGKFPSTSIKSAKSPRPKKGRH